MQSSNQSIQLAVFGVTVLAGQGPRRLAAADAHR